MITTHVLDISRGRPASGVLIALERRNAGDQWEVVGRGITDDDGRLRTLMHPDAPLVAGTYRLMFDTRTYFESSDTTAFYPVVVVVFDVAAGEAHCHVPLLLSPFGYSTYRGS